MKADWVVAGGKPGELGYCTRCGEGLEINLPQRFEIATAAMQAFVKIHSDCPPGQYHEKPPVTPNQWANGRDTGISSLTIYHVMTGSPWPKEHFDPDVPHDPSDFGRCYRVLKLFPAWRPRLKEVAERFPEWGPLVREWDELESLYQEEQSLGISPKLYGAMKLLISEGRKVAA